MWQAGARPGTVAATVAVLALLSICGFVSPVARAAPVPGTWVFVSEPAGQPFGRSMAALAFDPIQGLGLLFGGRDPGGTALGDTWVDDGDFPGHWSEFTDPDLASPPPLSAAALAWDAADHYFVLFGGTTANGTPYGGTWTFLNFAWTDISANQTSSPPPTALPTMAYDPSDGEIILSDPGNTTATFAFQAGQWRELSPSIAPGPRTGALFVDATTSGGAILFGGGSPATGTALNDTWNFSGGDWHPASGTSPPASSGPVGAWDPRVGGVVAFLGNCQETWAFVNGTWTPLNSPGATAPNVTTGESMYYDSVTAYDILFGGTDAFGHTPYGTWGWNIPAPFRDPTLTSAPVGTTTWIAVAVVVIVPILLALLWRRPPKPAATTAPVATPAAA
jgi:hypothetical protein